MEEVLPWFGQPSIKGRLKNRTDNLMTSEYARYPVTVFCYILQHSTKWHAMKSPKFSYHILFSRVLA